ncbi:hypothetical protein BDV98DRAFT_627221 [Pterulicium gracile]|uniref:Uncharacterized protein n=1 Tax=Pterulicium gracile TaxID=1884261 RepID=A0A5C3QCW4_9AGAR|nr:hypothetical protein BDV98DRAFT_627221 [Pterula gracilis]
MLPRRYLFRVAAYLAGWDPDCAACSGRGSAHPTTHLFPAEGTFRIVDVLNISQVYGVRQLHRLAAPDFGRCSPQSNNSDAHINPGAEPHDYPRFSEQRWQLEEAFGSDLNADPPPVSDIAPAPPSYVSDSVDLTGSTSRRRKPFVQIVIGSHRRQQFLNQHDHFSRSPSPFSRGVTGCSPPTTEIHLWSSLPPRRPLQRVQKQSHVVIAQGSPASPSDEVISDNTRRLFDATLDPYLGPAPTDFSGDSVFCTLHRVIPWSQVRPMMLSCTTFSPTSVSQPTWSSALQRAFGVPTKYTQGYLGVAFGVPARTLPHYHRSLLHRLSLNVHRIRTHTPRGLHVHSPSSSSQPFNLPTDIKAISTVVQSYLQRASVPPAASSPPLTPTVSVPKFSVFPRNPNPNPNLFSGVILRRLGVQYWALCPFAY